MPTHLYKVVVGIGADPSQKPSMGAFVVPNTPVHNELTDLATFQVSKDELQVLTGFNFLPELSTSETTNLCSTKENACRLRNWKEVELYFARKKIEYATSQTDIDMIMAQLEKKNIKLNKDMRALIESRRLELENNQAFAQRDSRRA